MARSRKKTPSVSYCPTRQRRWKNEQRHATRKFANDFMKKYDDETWHECFFPTLKSHSNLFDSPADQAPNERAMFPLRKWFDDTTLSNDWFRHCIQK